MAAGVDQDMVGVAGLTVRVKAWVVVPTLLVAVMVIGNVPLVAGVPDKAPVVWSRLTPVGNGPVSEKVGTGVPVAVTVNTLDTL